MPNQQVVFTLAAKCMDCYRCLKGCPVKAIRMKGSQAQVDPERCIACGTCVRHCPQKAKAYLNSTEAAKTALAGGNVIAMVAPSFAAFFDKWERLRFVGALRMLGFTRVEETAAHAYDVSAAVKTIIDTRPGVHICTACPAFNEYAEKYDNAATARLTPLVSPMAQHALQIQKQYEGRMRAVFVGPCIAKKKEAMKYPGLIEAVLTFEEVMHMFEERGIELKNCEESTFDSHAKGLARWYPLGGGLLRTAYDGDITKLNAYLPEGYDEIHQALEFAVPLKESAVIEPLFCKGGCVSGPGALKSVNFYEAKKRLTEYISSAPLEKITEHNEVAAAEFKFRLREGEEITEAQIESMLDRTGKAEEASRLNCGACGYNDCRQKAIAVIAGMAEPEMCIPRMRALAEQRTDRIIETSPNAIVIVNRELSIVRFNAAFTKMFGECTLNMHIGEAMDPIPFEKLVTGTEDKIETTAVHPKHGITCHQIFYSLKEDNQYVGIFVDLTRLSDTDKRLDEIKQKTMDQARQLLSHQLKMAQDMAVYLGENTAKSEELLNALLTVAGGGKNEDV